MQQVNEKLRQELRRGHGEALQSGELVKRLAGALQVCELLLLRVSPCTVAALVDARMLSLSIPHPSLPHPAPPTLKTPHLPPPTQPQKRDNPPPPNPPILNLKP